MPASMSRKTVVHSLDALSKVPRHCYDRSRGTLARWPPKMIYRFPATVTMPLPVHCVHVVPSVTPLPSHVGQMSS
jgi:hypothetical protein